MAQSLNARKHLHAVAQVKRTYPSPSPAADDSAGSRAATGTEQIHRSGGGVFLRFYLWWARERDDLARDRLAPIRIYGLGLAALMVACYFVWPLR